MEQINDKEISYKRKFIICRGIQGSGKSTWAKQWCHEDPEHRVRFNNDDIRNMLGDYWVPSREKVVTAMYDTLLTNAMNKGYNIVVDNMNLNPKTCEDLEKRVKDFNEHHDWKYEVCYQNFFIPVEECIRRDSMRPNPIGAKVIKETWRRYRSFIIHEEIMKMKENKRVQDLEKPFAIVLDMDATLCLNTTGRPFYGEGAADGMRSDEPVMEIVELVNILQLQGFYNIIILTGREDTPECRKATSDWLEAHAINPSKIYMRPKGNYSSGEECKKKIIEDIMQEYCVRLVIDDSNKCVKMYRDLGLICLQPNDGKF